MERLAHQPPDAPNQSRIPPKVLFKCLMPNLHRRTPARGSLYVPDMPNSREGHQAREPSKCLNGWSFRERLAKRPFDCQLQEARKNLWWGHNSCGGGSPCPCTLGATRVPASQAGAPHSRLTLTGTELPQELKKKKKKRVFCLCVQGRFCRV